MHFHKIYFSLSIPELQFATPSASPLCHFVFSLLPGQLHISDVNTLHSSAVLWTRVLPTLLLLHTCGRVQFFEQRCFPLEDFQQLRLHLLKTPFQQWSVHVTSTNFANLDYIKQKAIFIDCTNFLTEECVKSCLRVWIVINIL